MSETIVAHKPLSAADLNRILLKNLVSSLYQTQDLRIQLGNRLTAHFYTKIGVDKATTLVAQRQLDIKEKIDFIDVLKQDWRRITDAFADPAINKSLKTKKIVVVDDRDLTRKAKEKVFIMLDENIRGVFDEIFEVNMMAQYRDLVLQENAVLADIKAILERFPIWTTFLKDIKGCGPTMGAVIISTIDIHRADTPASLWAYAGLDVVDYDNQGNPDGRGRGKFTGHLVDREYEARDGTIKVKKSITYNPFLKTKLVGVLADIMIKHRTPGYRVEYDNYKHRIVEREILIGQAADERGDEDHKARKPSHIHRMSMRYMIKRLLVTLYVKWRTLENLPVTEEYGVRKLGLTHHAADGAWAQHMRKIKPPELDLPDEVDKAPDLF